MNIQISVVQVIKTLNYFPIKTVNEIKIEANENIKIFIIFQACDVNFRNDLY